MVSTVKKSPSIGLAGGFVVNDTLDVGLRCFKFVDTEKAASLVLDFAAGGVVLDDSKSWADDAR